MGDTRMGNKINKNNLKKVVFSSTQTDCVSTSSFCSKTLVTSKVLVNLLDRIAVNIKVCKFRTNKFLGSFIKNNDINTI